MSGDLPALLRQQRAQRAQFDQDCADALFKGYGVPVDKLNPPQAVAWAAYRDLAYSCGIRPPVVALIFTSNQGGYILI